MNSEEQEMSFFEASVIDADDINLEASNEENICVGFHSLCNPSSFFLKEIVSNIRSDAIGAMCKKNETIKMYGFLLYKRESSKMKIRRNMRYLASLYIEFKKIKTDVTKTEEMFLCDNFDNVVKAINVLSWDKYNKLKHGTMLLLGNLLKSVVKEFINIALLSSKDDISQEFDRFKTQLVSNWQKVFGEAEKQSISRNGISLQIKDGTTSHQSKIQLLKKTCWATVRELIKEPQKLNCASYTLLRRAANCVMTTVNPRRGNAIAALLINEYKEARDGTWVAQSKDETLLMGYQACKRKLVSFFLLKKLIPVLDILINPNVRYHCHVHQDNLHVFPMTKRSCSHASGTLDLSYMCQKATLKSNLTLSNLRCSLLKSSSNLSEALQKNIHLHLGIKHFKGNVLNNIISSRENSVKVSEYLTE